MSEKPEWLAKRTDEQLEEVARSLSKALQAAEEFRAAAVESIKACDADLAAIDTELAERKAARDEAYLDSLEVAPEGRGAFEPERVVPE